MGILQPLYYSGGRYTAGLDRKLLAAVMGSQSDGTRTVGIIGSDIANRGLKVAAGSGLNITVQPGLCVIADAATQDADSPGLYLAGIDSSALTVAVTGAGSGTRTDLIYAEISETPKTVTYKERSGTTVTLRTDGDHGYKVGQTVVVSGVDPRLDGSHTITAITTSAPFTFQYTSGTSGTISQVQITPTVTFGNDSYVVTNRVLTSNVVTLTVSSDPTSVIAVDDVITVEGVGTVFDGLHVVTAITSSTISYYRIAENVSTGAITNSTTALARVPFAIKQNQGSTTLPSVTAIPLAEITVSTTAVTAVTDRRKFVAAAGGVVLYNGSANQPSDAAEGQLAFDTDANSLYCYDGSAWTQIITGSSGRYYNAVRQASNTLRAPISVSGGSTSLNTTATTVCTTGSFVVIDNCYVLLSYSAEVVTGTVAGEYCILSVNIVGSSGGTSVSDSVSSGSTANKASATDGTAFNFSDYITVPSISGTAELMTGSATRLVYLTAGTYTFALRGFKSSSATNFSVNSAVVRVIPMYTSSF